MFLPIFIPVTNTTVINKIIVYSDTVLSPNDLGEYLEIYSVSNVSKYDLEKCLKTIFESNPNVVFNTIQYSRENKKIYFYTNEFISTKAWVEFTTTKARVESKYNTYKHLTSNYEIWEEVKRILVADENNNYDYISLYDVAHLMKKVNDDYDKTIDRYGSRLDNMIKSKFGNSTSILIYNFDYKNSELKIIYNGAEIAFSKRNGNLHIVKSESSYGNEILTVIGNELSKLYDKLIKFHDYKIQYKCHIICSPNSNFLVNIHYTGVEIFYPKIFSSDFKLNSFSYKNSYSYNCNSSLIINTLNGKEDELFKKIFVKIKDCPEWTQPILSKTRQNQLAEEMKAQKRLELKRKFSLGKKNN